MKYLGVFFFLLLVATLVMAMYDSKKLRAEREALYRQAYQGWVKLEARPDITFEEWKALKNTGMIRQ